MARIDRSVAVLLVLLVAVIGLLTWAVVPDRSFRCLWAVTIGENQSGYVEVPCGLSVKQTMKYFTDHPHLPQIPISDLPNGGR